MEIKTPQTTKSKIVNFWYYNKWYVIAGLFVILLIAMFISDKKKQVDYDYTVAVMSSYVLLDDTVSSLQDIIKQYGEDQNGDGAVNVLVQNYAMSSSATAAEQAEQVTGADAQIPRSLDPQLDMANKTKFMADCQVGESMIYIATDDLFQDYAKQGLFAYKDGSTPAEGAVDYDNMKTPIADCVGFKEVYDPNGSMEGMTVSLRAFQGTGLDKKEENAKYFEASRKMLDFFIKGEKQLDLFSKNMK